MTAKRNPDRVFHPYVANVTKKTLRLEEFMAANEEDETDFDAWRLNTLETHITSLRDQVSRMKTDWDVMRDNTMSAAVFNTHCPILNMNEKKPSKFQFNFPTLLGPCPMLKKLSKKNSFLGPPR
jgi:hypothetical protein